LAGSGKTKLAQAFARWLSESAECYKVVPVGADWTGNENVLGYPNGLDKDTYVSKPTLDLLIHARENPEIPHFLILDEMNLSHVERYFADILSLIESDEEIQLYDGAERKANGKVIPKSIELPKNLFIIGTVNVDETTYMFSPKVLDRANVIEFRMDSDELESFLSNPAKPDLSKLDGKGASFGRAFVDAAKISVNVPLDVKPAYEAEMLLFFKALQAHSAEFGYRTAHEAARFVYFYKLLGNHPDGDATWFPKAFDYVVLQKLLPKLHGSRAKLGPLLKVLWFLCVNDADHRGADPLKAAEAAARSTDKKAEPSTEVPADAPYPLSAEKIGRMWRLLRDNGFASFAEA
jgi:5-methylcytosine-specific restriction protein B